MKKRIWLLVVGILLIATSLFAADGDLIVEGKIGVGTTNPGYTLDVNGDMRLPNAKSIYFGTTKGMQLDSRWNMMFGFHAGNSLGGDSNNNFCMGVGALSSTSSGIDNIAIGDFAMGSITDPTYPDGVMNNVAIGTYALSGINVTTGSIQENFAIGPFTLEFLSKGVANMAMGSAAGMGLTAGDFNVFVGNAAGYGIGSGSGNTIIGGAETFGAGANITSGSYNLVLGMDAGPASPGAYSNKMWIHNTQSDTPLIFGDFAASVLTVNGKVGIGTTNPGSYKLYVNGSAYFAGGYSSPSDIRFKRDITPIESPLDKVLGMTGVAFDWNTEEYTDKGFPEGRHYGVIAQELENILPEVVSKGPGGDKSVAYTEIIPVLIEAIKEQQKEITQLREALEELSARVK